MHPATSKADVYNCSSTIVNKTMVMRNSSTRKPFTEAETLRLAVRNTVHTSHWRHAGLSRGRSGFAHGGCTWIYARPKQSTEPLTTHVVSAVDNQRLRGDSDGSQDQASPPSTSFQRHIPLVVVMGSERHVWATASSLSHSTSAQHTRLLAGPIGCIRPRIL